MFVDGVWSFSWISPVCCLVIPAIQCGAMKCVFCVFVLMTGQQFNVHVSFSCFHIIGLLSKIRVYGQLFGFEERFDARLQRISEDYGLNVILSDVCRKDSGQRSMCYGRKQS